MKNKNEYQIKICEKIIKRIDEKNYHDASILIRYYLNDKSFSWYKPIENIIENQITNLFYDLTYGTDLTREFFKHQIEKLKYDLQRFKIADE